MGIDRLAVLVSGGGTNLQAVLDACADGRIPAKVVCVVSSRPGVYALERAKKAGVPAEVIRPKEYPSQDEHDAAVMRTMERYGAQGVVLAGYMSILGSILVRQFQHRIVNVHPALIPSFCGKGYYGHRVHEAVLAYGAKVSGATVHFVDEGTDTGPIIMQRCVPVLDDDTPDTLAARILTVEHELLPKSVALLCEGRLKVEGRRVLVD